MSTIDLTPGEAAVEMLRIIQALDRATGMVNGLDHAYANRNLEIPDGGGEPRHSPLYTCLQHARQIAPAIVDTLRKAEANTAN